VDLVEFMDYECPFCRRHFESTFAPLLAQYGTRVRYVVMNFPIPELHPGAMPAAEAAECANQQGKFWEMHERLLRTEAYDAASLKRQATALKLDRARFDRCLDSGAMRGLIKQHQDQGIALGVSGTPAFFINGRKIEGAMPLGVFAQAIEAALAGTTQ
jgi:protein-disulfide isomerase